MLRETRGEQLAAFIQQQLETWPPLSDEQRRNIASLLGGATDAQAA